MPKNENNNGKNLLKVLKTLEYSPIARYIKNVACVSNNYSVGAQIKFDELADDSCDNLLNLSGYLSLTTYSDNTVSIPLRGNLYYCHTSSSTGVEVNTVDLTNSISFVFSADVANNESFELLKYGLYNLFNSNNNNNNNSNNTQPYYPTVTLSAGPLLLKNAQYIYGNENISCFALPNYRIYLIASDRIVYLSPDPSILLNEYKNFAKANEQNNNSK